MFKRRRGPLHPDQIREFVAPRKGWDRGWKYVHARIRRLPGSPHSIALGVSLGIFVSFTPLFGLHVLLALALAWLMQASLVAALLGTLSGNPLTFPFIAAASIRIGNFLLGTRVSKSEIEAVPTLDLLRGFPQLVDSILLPYIAGGFIAGAVGGSVAYLLVRPTIVAYQAARRRRLRRRSGKRPSRTTKVLQ